MSKFFLSILRNFMKKEYVDKNLGDLTKLNFRNPHEFLGIEKIYLGPSVQILIENKTVNIADLKSFRLRALEYYQTLCSEIRKRFDFNNPVLKNLQLLEPTSILSGKFISLMPLAKEFPNIESNIHQLNFEYRQLMNIKWDPWTKVDTQMYAFWLNVFAMQNAENGPLFPILSKFVKAMFSLPHSTAEVE